MSEYVRVRLHTKPTRIRILPSTDSLDIEPLALEDFRDDTPITDQPSSESPAPETPADPTPAEEPRFTIEQVQQEVQTAYDRGFADGQNVATAILETEVNTLTERLRNLDSAIVELQRQYADAIAQTERVALDLAITIARTILGYEAQQSERCVLEQARAALEQYHGKDAVTIRVHPSSLEALQRAGNQLATGTGMQSITLVADPTVEPGSCILETALGTFDAQLSTQLQRARTLLAMQMTGAPSSPEEQSNAV